MNASAKTVSSPNRNPLTVIVDAFDSIWLGIFLIVLIFLYSAIGSAVPTFRQTFELTEFQYFNHPVFVTLIALFCITLTVTTLRRIAFNWRNAGVLTVHTGLLILCGASVVYFGQKIEGDVWLDAPKVQILSIDRMKRDPESAVIGEVVATRGEAWDTDIPMLGGKHRVEVLDVKHSGLTTGHSVELKFSAGAAESPMPIKLTSDTKETMVAKLNDRLAVLLKPSAVTDAFYDETTALLEITAGGHRDGFEIPSLPYYAERFVEGVEPIVDTDGKPVASGRTSSIPPFERWQMPIDLRDNSRASSADWGFSVSIDGYLPYARLDPRPISGNGPLMPIMRARLDSGEMSESDWLVAQMPERSLIELEGRAVAEFRWVDAATSVDSEWTRSVEGRHVLEVFVKDKNIRKTFDVSEGQSVSVDGTDYKLTVQELRPNWPLMSPGFQNARTPIALVWVEGGTKGAFQRSVMQRYPKLNQDRDKEGKKINADGSLVDDNIELTYTDASRDWFTIVAGESLAPMVIHTSPGGKRTLQKLESNTPFAPAPRVQLTMSDYIQRPEFVTQPTVIPPRNRRSLQSVRRGESLIRVVLTGKDGKWTKRVWVPFSIYNTDHDGTRPTVASDIPGVGDVRLVYGRTKRILPGRLALERLHTEYYPGRQQASMWSSYFRQQDLETGVVLQSKAWLNNTARVGEWTLFQSQAPADGKSWTVLGVGNRQGVYSMGFGCLLITLGMIYAWTVKPILVERRKRRFAQMNQREAMDESNIPQEPAAKPRRQAATVALLAALLIGGSVARATDMPDVAANLAAIAGQIDVTKLSSIAVQHSWRYATVDSWARDAIKSIHGSKPFHDLDPVLAAFELMFNGSAYHKEPVIYVKDLAVLKDLIAHPVTLPEDERRRILTTKMVSYDFLRSPIVAERIKQLSGDTLRKTAMDRLQTAINMYESIGFTLNIVPHANGQPDAPWSPLLAASAMSKRGDTGLTDEQTLKVSDLAMKMRLAWSKRDASAINSSISELEQTMQSLAPAGVYPSAESRSKEVTYRRLNLMRWAWGVYIFAFFVSIFAVASGYEWVRWFGLFFLCAAVGLHGYDIALRWAVIGRIPVANMYEAVTSSTWIGAMLGLLLELFLRKRVFLLGSALLGFITLALPELLPDQVDNKLTTMMPILDDIMLRIHTVLIIASYAVITLAFGVANCYLFVTAIRDRVPLAQSTIGAQFGVLAALGAIKMDWIHGSRPEMYLLAFASAAIGGALVVRGLGGVFLRGAPKLATAGFSAGAFPVKRSMLEEFDFSHRVLIYTATISLFVGLVLGAVWADYSWGRPWGWDPKEVFALCTWLIYAILIHAKFVTRRGPLWTSVLSVVGFAVMQFNWWVVNFYIVGLHSYA